MHLQLGTATVTTITTGSGYDLVPTVHPTSPPSSSIVVLEHTHLSTEAIIVTVVTLVTSCCMLFVFFILYAKMMRRQGKPLFSLRSIRAARVLDEASAYHADNSFAFSVENTMHSPASPAKKKRISLSSVVPVRQSVDLGEIDLDMHEEWERGNRDCIPVQENGDARSMENGEQETQAGVRIRNTLTVSVGDTATVVLFITSHFLHPLHCTFFSFICHSFFYSICV